MPVRRDVAVSVPRRGPTRKKRAPACDLLSPVDGWLQGLEAQSAHLLYLPSTARRSVPAASSRAFSCESPSRHPPGPARRGRRPTVPRVHRATAPTRGQNCSPTAPTYPIGEIFRLIIRLPSSATTRLLPGNPARLSSCITVTKESPPAS